jgi:hypothetical protein
VNRAITLSGPVRDVLLHSRQATLLYALENIDATLVDDELLNMVDQFETVAAPELRPRLARVILQLLEKNLGRSALRPVVERILEVSPDRGMPETRSAGREQIDSRIVARLRMFQETPNDVVPAHSAGDTNEIPLLPPGRYHYTEETKLNAISLIVASRNPGDYELVEQGISRLGSMDLHSALHALESADRADDDFVYKTIEGHMSAILPEYRIYCAWLLRERYGLKPSQFLLQLLSAEETRVHKYTFSLFDTRQIEKELLDGILAELNSIERIKPWLLIYRIKLLGRRESFAPPDLGQLRGQDVATKLKAVSKHPLPHVRLAAYRSLRAYPEFVNRATVAQWMRADAEPRIRSLAPQIGA